MKKILLVEDNGIIAMTEKAQLQKYGYEVVVVKSGEEALIEVENDFDIILMDINLGDGIDGTEAAEIILRTHDIPIIFVSSHTEKEIVKKTESITSYGYVIKNSGIIILDASIKMAFKLFEEKQKTKYINHKLEAALDAIPDTFIEMGLDGTVYDIHTNNPDSIVGPIEELIGKNISLLVPKEVSDVYFSALAESNETGFSMGKQFSLKVPAGIRNFEINVSRKKNGSDPHFVVIRRDTTEHTKIEKEIYSVIEDYKRAENISKFGSWQINILTGESKASEGSKKIYGFTDDNFNWEEIKKLRLPEYNDSSNNIINLVVSTGIPQEYEYMIKSIDGKIKNIMSRIEYSSEKKSIFGIIRDITEEKLFQRKIFESEERLRRAFNAIPYPVMIRSSDGNIEFINEEWTRLSGYTIEDIPTSDDWCSKAYGDKKEEIMKMIKDSYSKQMNSSSESEVTSKNGNKMIWSFKYSKIGEIAEKSSIITVATDVTEKKNIENTLIEYNSRFELAMKSANMAWWEMNITSGEVKFDPRKATMLGYQPSDFKHYNDFMKLIHPEDYDKVMNAMKNHLYKETEKYEIEYRIKSASGEYMWFYDVGKRIEHDIEKTNRVSGTIMNITGRKDSEEKLIRNELRLQKLVNILQFSFKNTQDLLDYSLSQIIELTSSKYGYIYHYDSEKQQFILNTWSKDVMESCKIQNPNTCYELSKTGIWGETVRQRKPIILNDFESHHPLKKGYPEGHVSLKKFMTVPVYEEDKIVGVIGLANKGSDYDDSDVFQVSIMMNTIWKIVGKKKIEDELKYEQSLVQTLMNSVVDHMYFKDKDGKFIMINKSLAQTFDINPQEAVGKTDYDFFEHKFAEDHAEDEKKIFGDGFPITKEEYGGMLNQLDSWLLTTKMPLWDSEKNIIGTFGISTDITNQKKSEERIYKLLQEKETLLIETNHRIKNNITAIEGLLTLSMDDAKSEEAISALKSAVSRVASVRVMYEKLLASEDLKMISIKNYIEDLSQTVLNLFPNNEKISLNFDIQDFTVNSKQLFPIGIIINEKITNIMKHAFIERESGIISIICNIQNDVIILSISDNGVGLPQGFDINSSTGFGMMLINMMAQQLSATIKIESNPNTKFTFVFKKSLFG